MQQFNFRCNDPVLIDGHIEGLFDYETGVLYCIITNIACAAHMNAWMEHNPPAYPTGNLKKDMEAIDEGINRRMAYMQENGLDYERVEVEKNRVYPVGRRIVLIETIIEEWQGPAPQHQFKTLFHEFFQQNTTFTIYE